MSQEMAGEDASVMAAVSKIMALGPEAMGFGEPKQPAARENRTDRDPIEREADGDLEGEEGQQRQAAQEQDKTEEKAATEEAADFLEIPGEGDEVEKVPLSEAVEAVKQYRAIKGDIAAAVTKAEMEAHQRMDAQLNQIVQIHQQVAESARMALQSLPFPQPPSRALLAQDPEAYHQLMLDYEDRMALYQDAERQSQQASAQHQRAVAALAEQHASREHERVARFIPEWKDEATRAQVQQRLYGFMEKAYGLKAEDLDLLPFDHRFVRAMNDLATFKEGQTKAPEVKKAVQEKAPKIVATKAQPRAKDGTFVSTARDQLKSTGSDDAFARLLMSDPSLRKMLG